MLLSILECTGRPHKEDYPVQNAQLLSWARPWLGLWLEWRNWKVCCAAGCGHP